MALRPAFVLTALAACSPSRDIPAGNPPEPVQVETPEATAPESPSASATAAPREDPSPDDAEDAPAAAKGEVTTPPASATGDLNPKDGDGRTILRAFNGDGCFVYLPFPPLKKGDARVPGQAPPMREASCPPRLLDPAYDTCRGGIIRRKDAGCECFVAANPPRISPHACPTKG